MSIGSGSQCLKYLQEELSKVDETWAVARFDSLPHVVHILTSKDRDGEAQLLKEQSDVIEEVVDVVVHAYHGGFNKAIQNYSQILRLFSESAERLAVLNGDLVEAKKLIGARNKQLHQLWYRSMTLRHIISLLDQIEALAKVPSRLEKLILQKQFYAAVQLHVQSTLTLEREGLQTVGALQEVRSEFTKLRGVLFYKVLEDLHDHLYSKGDYSLDEGREVGALKLSDSRTLSKFTGLTNTGIPSWLSLSNPDEFVELVKKSDSPLRVKYLHTMVECLCMLGKVSAAGAIICQRMRSTVHEIITSKVKSQAVTTYMFEGDNMKTSHVSAASNDFLKGRVEGYHLSKQISPNNGIVGTISAVSPVTPVMAPFGKAQAAAKELLHSVLDTVVGIFENHVIVGEILESKSSQLSSMNTLKSVVPDSNISSDYETSQSTGGYSVGSSLSVIQSECQQLICEILRATPDAASADAAIQTARLASKVSSKGKRDESDNVLTFAFRFTDATISVPNNGSDVHQGWNRRGPNVSKEGFGSSVVLPEQGIYLAASLYRPVLQFTDKVSSLLPKEYSQLSKDGLQSFVENFVKDHFLPTMFVDYRKSLQQAISNPAAFRPRSHAVGSYTPSVGKGRPILQGILTIDFLCKEILGWAQSMPRFFDDLVTYVQTLLERAYERCRTAYMEVVLEKLSYMLIGRHDVDSLMKKDPSSSCLSNLNTTQNPSEVVAVGTEFGNFLLSLGSVKQDSLIREDGKLILLASLSDSLEYLADSISRMGEWSTGASTQLETDRNQKPPTHNRTSSTPPKDLCSFTDEYRKLAADCLKVLRVEMQLVTVFHMQEMSSREYLEEEDTEEPDDFIISLTSQISCRDEEVSPFVSASKRDYIFGGIYNVAASAFIKALADMKSINLFGIQQICRNSIALEQVIVAIPSIDKEHVQQVLDHVRTYYELLNMPFEALLAFIAEHVDLFSAAEYSCLLKVHVPGREVPPDAEQQLSEILSL